MQWLTEVDAYLAEFLRLEGRGDFIKEPCRGCGTDLKVSGFRCRDCHDLAMYCQTCIVNVHAPNPLHRVQVSFSPRRPPSQCASPSDHDVHYIFWQLWENGAFVKMALKDLGLRIQLGHPVGEKCVNPVIAFGDAFVVLDITSVHQVGVDFCGCECALLHYVQVLCQRWFPTTSVDPQTAVTFSLLEHFHLLSVQSKVSAFEYYTTLSRRTDNTGVDTPKVCLSRISGPIRI